MKALIVLCVLAGTVFAAPKYKRASTLDPKLSEHVAAAEKAWVAAEKEKDPAQQATRWEEAANAFALVDGDPLDAKIKREAALASILAWKNALAAEPAPPEPAPPEKSSSTDVVTPRPLPARQQRVIAAIDRYVGYATDPSDPQVPGMLFIKANTYRRFDQHDSAIPLFQKLIDSYPRDEVAEYAANLLLDTYNRLQKYDELIALATKLYKNKAFLKDRDDLAATVMRIVAQARARADHHRIEGARQAKDTKKLVEEANEYLALYNADPQDPSGDEHLYNAAILFQEGKAIGAAIDAYVLLRKQYPKSKLAARTLARLGKLYGDVAMFAEAVVLLEEYAKKYAGEKDAYDAMSDAIFYRKALGDRDKAIEDTKYFIKTFGAKKPAYAASAMWSLTAFYELTPDVAIKHLREYLRTYGSKGGADRVVMAHAKIGQLLWKQSCKVPGLDGLCVKTVEKAPRTCGKASTPAIAAVARDATKAKEALTAFTAAIREFERNGGDLPAEARYYYAQAKLAVGDQEMERYLMIAFPRDLDFDPARSDARQASMKRFSTWIEDKQKAGSAANRAYEVVIGIKDAASSITAAHRLGLTSQAFANALVAAEIPKSVKGDDLTAAYCEVMTTTAEPLEARAVMGFGVCLAKSTELGWWSDSSTACERELLRMKPEEFPALHELRSTADHDALVVVAEPPLR
jgi:tetratricopeptide (TPR) repeat protein